MGVTIPTERERLKAEYLAAFAATNPGHTLPRLRFYRGWWELHGELPGRIRRIRTTQLQRMIATLQAKD